MSIRRRKFVTYEEAAGEHIELQMFRSYETLPPYVWIYDRRFYFKGSPYGFFGEIVAVPGIKLMALNGRDFAWNQCYQVYDAVDDVPSCIGFHNVAKPFTYNKNATYAFEVKDETDAIMQAALRGIQVFDFKTDKLTKISLMHGKELSI